MVKAKKKETRVHFFVVFLHFSVCKLLNSRWMLLFGWCFLCNIVRKAGTRFIELCSMAGLGVVELIG
jgi:hypothetical protein